VSLNTGGGGGGPQHILLGTGGGFLSLKKQENKKRKNLFGLCHNFGSTTTPTPKGSPWLGRPVSGVFTLHETLFSQKKLGEPNQPRFPPHLGFVGGLVFCCLRGNKLGFFLGGWGKGGRLGCSGGIWWWGVGFFCVGGCGVSGGWGAFVWAPLNCLVGEAVVWWGFVGVTFWFPCFLLVQPTKKKTNDLVFLGGEGSKPPPQEPQKKKLYNKKPQNPGVGGDFLGKTHRNGVGGTKNPKPNLGFLGC